MNVGIIGCGNISQIYLSAPERNPALRITAVADQVRERAEAKAKAHGLRALSVDALLADPDIGLVINLTIPAAHGPVAMRALEAGKHVYNEKPLAITREDARAMLALAARKGLRVGGAPFAHLPARRRLVVHDHNADLAALCRRVHFDGRAGRLMRTLTAAGV